MNVALIIPMKHKSLFAMTIRTQQIAFFNLLKNIRFGCKISQFTNIFQLKSFISMMKIHDIGRIFLSTTETRKFFQRVIPSPAFGSIFSISIMRFRSLTVFSHPWSNFRINARFTSSFYATPPSTITCFTKGFQRFFKSTMSALLHKWIVYHESIVVHSFNASSCKVVLC